MSGQSNYRNTIENNLENDVPITRTDTNAPIEDKAFFRESAKYLREWSVCEDELKNKIEELNKVLQEVYGQYERYCDVMKVCMNTPIKMFSFSLEEMPLFQESLTGVCKINEDSFSEEVCKSQEEALSIVNQFVNSFCSIQKSCNKLKKMMQEVSDLLEKCEEILKASEGNDFVNMYIEQPKQEVNLQVRLFLDRYKEVYSKLKGGKKDE